MTMMPTRDRLALTTNHGRKYTMNEAQKRANEKYLRNHYQRLYLNYPKEFTESVKESARQAGETISQYIRRAVEERQNREKSTISCD